MKQKRPLKTHNWQDRQNTSIYPSVSLLAVGAPIVHHDRGAFAALGRHVTPRAALVGLGLRGRAGGAPHTGDASAVRHPAVARQTTAVAVQLALGRRIRVWESWRRARGREVVRWS